VKREEYEDFEFDVLPRYWVDQSHVNQAINAFKWKYKWLLAWRDIANAKVERTITFSVIPWSGVGDTASLIFADHPVNLIACLLANFNSLILDYCARQIVGGTHLTYGYLKQLPILPPSAYDEAALAFIVPRVLELTYTSHSMAPFARDLGYEGPPFAWDEDRRAQLRAELDAWYALAYGLSRDELRYVLDPKDVMGEDYPSETFRVLQKHEIARHGEYRTRRLVLAAYDALVGQGMRPRVEGYR